MNAHVQTLPSNIEAEQEILGTLLVRNDAMSTVPAEFSADHFSERAHLEIFAAIKNGVAAGRAVNPVTVRSFISPNFANEKVGDMTMAAYIARLAVQAVGTSLKGVCEAVTDAFHRRQAISAAEEAHIAAYSSRDELEFVDRINDARERLNEILASISRRNEPEESFLDSVDETDAFTADAMAGRKPLGIYPGIPELEHLIGGYQKGQLIIIGGGVKQGKSSLAWQSFFEMSSKHVVAGNSGEMPREQIIMREKARRTGISTNRQKAGKVSYKEMEELVLAGIEMKRLKVAEINCQRMTLDQLDDRINRLCGEKGIEAYVLDHIGKLAWTGKMEHEDEFKQGQRATSMLKDMAMKRDIPIIALTHLKKSAFQEYGGRSFKERLSSALYRRPTYRDLVGSMDKDADHVILPFQARPIVAGMEPEEGTSDHALWEAAMDQTAGKAELILSLSREREFPKRKEIEWHGDTTSFGPAFKSEQNSRELF